MSGPLVVLLCMTSGIEYAPVSCLMIILSSVTSGIQHLIRV